MEMNIPTARKTFTVFELVNDRLHEIYVAATEGPVFNVVADLRRQPAPSIRHWDLDDVGPVRSVEFGLNGESARKFIDEYVHNAVPDGWHCRT